MEAQEKNNTGKPLSLSQILLSKNNPFLSSAKVKSSSEQNKKRPVGPTTNYEFVRIFPENPEKHGRRKKMKKDAEMGSRNSREPCSPALEKANEVESSLSHEHPTFIKPMQPSNVAHPFFMRLPRPFCKLHLPISEATPLILEDENGNDFEIKYLPHYNSFSGGWKYFAVSKKLQKDDVLVFHLVQPRKFKVYITRTNDDEVDTDPTVPKPRAFNLEKKKASETPKRNPNVVEANTSTREDQNSQTTSDVTFSKTVSSFKNFKIVVNNQTINSEISPNIRTRYFFLCCTRNSFLHRHLIKGIGIKLAASIITETTNIADTIRNSEMSTPREDIAYWNTALQSFEFFGMDVGFIQARLNRLLNIARDCSKNITDLKKDKSIYDELDEGRIEEEIKEHENKIEDLKMLKRKIEMRGKECMDDIVDKYKAMYKEEAKDPW